MTQSPQTLPGSLCCPYPDHGRIAISDDKLICQTCARDFPLLGGRPVLFDEGRSIFSTDNVRTNSDTRQFPAETGLKNRLRKLLPAGSSRDSGHELFKKAKSLLGTNPVVLVIGCGFTGGQYRRAFPDARLVLTDVTLQGDADIACDGECLPFLDESVDLIIIDQVLEHTLNPQNVISEIVRCLKLGGLVYSGIPFMTPVHGFPYDFQRYTPLGHRMLFRRFEEISFQVTQGAASAVSKNMIEALGGNSQRLWWRRMVSMIVRLVAFPFLKFDLVSATAPAATAFLGAKTQTEPDIHKLASVINNANPL